MGTIVTILAVLAIALAAFLCYVATKPNTFTVERSQRIQASPAAVFDKVNDLRQFNSWNPFARADQTTRIVYEGPASGAGSGYTWNSNGKGGAGKMTILESACASKVSMRLEFRKPFVAENRADFSFVGDGSSTNVTWKMTGHNSYLHKLLGTLFNMDKLVGGEFAKGLAALKSQLEPR